MQRSTPEPGKRLMGILEQTAQACDGTPTWTRKRTFQPAVDLKDSCREVVVFVDVPGMDEDDIDIAVEGQILVVSGVREFDHDSEDAEEYLRIERPYGPFECSVELPSLVNFDLATAKYKRGVLKIRLPKPIAPGRRTLHLEGD